MNEDIYSEPFTIVLPPMRIASAVRIGTEPEDEVILFLRQWAKDRGVDGASARMFGFDVPVSDAEKSAGIRGYEFWIQVPEHITAEGEVQIINFPGGEFITLRIREPFADPFDRIPKGWQMLVKHIREHGVEATFCPAGNCLEEVITVGGVCYMDVMIKLA